MLQILLNILFPSPCLQCGYLSRPLCKMCWNHLSFEPHVRAVDELKVYSAMRYQADSILSRLVHPFKYKHQSNLFRVFVPHMIRALQLMSDWQDVIFVPVPLHPKRRRERGYNQAELLARWLGKELGRPVCLLLKRTRHTGSQARTEGRDDRIKNMKGAFELERSPPKHGRIILVDDIVTTGSTLLACRDALQDAGVESIAALTLANREKIHRPRH